MDHPRMQREAKTVKAMIRIYCRNQHHSSNVLCDDCQALEDYAMARLARCPFQEDKPTCVKCPIHCYKPEMREKIRKVMGYAGPRMLGKHPVLAIKHTLRPSPPDIGKKNRADTP